MMSDRIIAVRNNKTIYRDGDSCIKVFNKDFSKASVLNEALNQARVEETGLNIPKIREVTTIDGSWAIISDFIKGKTLSELMKENPDKKEEYINRLVDLQLEMHAKECPDLFRLKDKLNDKITATDLSATVRYDLHTRLNGMPKHTKLCHGDFNPSNIIISEDGAAYIIDWSHATRGNASADAARTYLTFWLDGDISGAKLYLKTFCDKSDTAIQYVQKWMPLVAASQLIRGNEKEREFLMSWIDVVDYD